MTVQKIQTGVIRFIDNEIVPKSNVKEKFIIGSAAALGVLNIEPYIEEILKHPIMKHSNIWTDESKTDFKLESIKQVAYNFLDNMDGKFKYDGYKINTAIYQDTLFGGFVIDRDTVDKLFQYIEEA